MGRLRLIGFLEGLSLVALIFIAVPLKYFFSNPALSKFLGPIHGAIFLLFLLNTVSVGIEQNWKFKNITWKVLLASFIPFGTFYIDHTILRKISDRGNEQTA